MGQSYLYATVSSRLGSTVDIYTYNQSNTSTTAYTSFFDKNDNKQSSTYDYWWCEIQINNKYKYDDSINHNATLTHEFGHVLGLAHNNYE